jgi:adenylylsulfate kinase
VWQAGYGVAAEISYLLEQRRQPYALLDLDYLGWGGDNFDDHAVGLGLMLRNLRAVASNYRDAGISVFVVAYFIRNHHALGAVREATGIPLGVVRLSVPLPEIERRLAADMTSGRRDDLREAVSSITAGDGIGVEDMTVVNDQPVAIVAQEIMTWLGWQ